MTDPHPDAPAGRPFVTLNVAASVDGKIAPVGGGKVNFGGPEDRVLMETLRAGADAVLIGGGTLRAEDPPLLIRDPAIRAARVEARGAPHPLNVVVTSSLPDDLDRMDFFREPETRKLAFTTARTPAALRATAARFARVEVVAPDASGRVNLVAVVESLHALGVRRLLLEGGGALNFSMLDADLIDEVHLTLCPFLFGGRTAPTPFDGAGFTRDRVRKLALQDHRIGARGEIFLRYLVLPGSPDVVPGVVFRKGYEIR